MDDLTLLKAFEPVVRFTEGELFFPAAVEGYVKRSSLWVSKPDGRREALAAPGQLTLDSLAGFDSVPPGCTLYLQCVQQPLQTWEYGRWLLRPNRPVFRAAGRLARVGLFTRMFDSFFDLALLLRGRVPGGTGAAAEIAYRQDMDRDPRYVYYGRVVRNGGYIILNYLFFYYNNNWRSGFHGVNDHEADWEQIFVYLSEAADGQPVPRWVAYASHDFSGDDLRRRWDDPELHREGDHPVVYAGAGSHASYYLPGEYMMGATPAFLKPVQTGLQQIHRIWSESLGQGMNEKTSEQVRNLFSVPFVDYARGDGTGIGPGQDNEWTAVVLDGESGWAEMYRGLWGLDTKDPLGGERAPGGPKYDRDGAVRRSWYDPLGWSGLDKVAPPELAADQLQQQIETLSGERETTDTEIGRTRDALRRLELEDAALREASHNKKQYESQRKSLEELQVELARLNARRTALGESIEAGRLYLEKVRRGDWGDPQAHIRHRHPPEPPIQKTGRFVEFWAAMSGGLLLLTLIGLIFLYPGRWIVWTILVGGVFLGIEATLRGRLATFLINLIVVLAVLTAAILAKDFFVVIIVAGLAAVLLWSTLGNLREVINK